MYCRIASYLSTGISNWLPDNCAALLVKGPHKQVTIPNDPVRRNLIVNVTEAVNARKSVRAFLPKPEPEETVRQILIDAARAPSGGNLQPWKTYVMAGAARDELLRRVREQWEAGNFGEGTEYDIYP